MGTRAYISTITETFPAEDQLTEDTPLKVLFLLFHLLYKNSSKALSQDLDFDVWYEMKTEPKQTESRGG